MWHEDSVALQRQRTDRDRDLPCLPDRSRAASEAAGAIQLKLVSACDVSFVTAITSERAEVPVIDLSQRGPNSIQL
jgi:hypothetical protein